MGPWESREEYLMSDYIKAIPRNIRSLIRYPFTAFRSAIIRRSMSRRLPENLIKFLIISAPRSGSNLLCGLLNSHPQIVCFHEMFHRKAIFYGPKNNNQYDFGTTVERDRDPVQFLSRIYSSAHGYKAVGFKMFNGHNNSILSALIKNKSIKKIVLHRKAALHAFSSLEIARITGKYQSVGENETSPAKSTKIHLDSNLFKAYVDQNEAFYDRVNKRIGDQPYIAIDYVDIVKSTSQYNKILPFIGVEDSSSLKAIHRRQNPEKLKDKIDNFDEICGVLSGTKYAGYLKEEL